MRTLLFEHDLFGKPVPTFPDHALLFEHDLRANASRLSRGKTGTHPRVKPEGMLFRIMLYRLSMIFSENRYPLFRIML